jgi:hypothetical protein
MEPQARMIITLMPDGQVNVEGIPNNKMFAYGLLEVAREAMTDFFKRAAEQRIQPAVRLPFKPS